ncbi:hypothetical protein GALMADRAFT_247070 [Galerina marginata CBS 339.88]|uniref:Uncharacterized protein n=1 Tax=Galerina marginata (strain CBS 339.88) TaxID=685588 RepID=A0A067TCG1_GALM3|nr:hypothetical protein GALMADRAFT_247070 [Galerina marginata CBS 339.88]
MNSVLTQSSQLHTTAAHLARRDFEPDDRSKDHSTPPCVLKTAGCIGNTNVEWKVEPDW